jgi:uncharacterized protein YhjY with autotransporter beta-barrel domain
MKNRVFNLLTSTRLGLTAASLLFATSAIAQTSPYIVNGTPTANTTVVSESGASDQVTTSAGTYNPASALSDTGGNTTVTIGSGTTIVVTSSNNSITLTSGSVDNFGSVTAPSGSTAVVFNSTPATVTNENGATLLGGKDGVAIQAGGMVTNSGTITGTNTDGIFALTGPATVVNNSGSSISGGFNGLDLEDGGTVTNSGTLTGTNEDGVIVLNAFATVTNNAGGTITGSDNGLDLEEGATVTNDGTIRGTSGFGSGILILHQAGTVTNQAAGSITGGEVGIDFNVGGTLDNSGTISGPEEGVLVDAAIGHVTNRAGGTITGGDAINMNAGGDVTNSGVIGNNSTGFGVLITGGTGTVTNKARGTIMGTIQGVEETLGGTVTNGGQISSSNSNAVHISGGTGTVQNLAGGTLNGQIDAVELDSGGTVNNAGTITSQTDYAVFGATTIFNSGTITSLEGTQGIPDQAYNAVFLNGTFTNVGGTVSAPNLYYAVQFTGNNNTANIGNLSRFNGDLDRDLFGGGGTNEVLNFNFLGGTIGTPQGTPAYGSLTAQGETYTYQAFTAVNVTGTSLASLGSTPNESAIGGAVDRAIDQAGASGVNPPNLVTLDLALANVFGNSNAAAVADALSQLSPEKFAAFTSATAFNNASFETQAMDGYLASLRSGPNGAFVGTNGGIDTSGLTLNDPNYDPTLSMIHSRLMAWNPAPFGGAISDVSSPLLGGMDMKDTKSSISAPASTNPWDIFVRGNVILAQGFSQTGVPHFDDNTESVTLGADYRFTPNFLFGLTAGYAHTDVTLDTVGSSATVDSYSPGFYASYADHGWYANLAGDYLHNAYTQDRHIAFLGQTASSAPEGNEGVVNLDGGYDFHHGALAYGPLAGIQYTHLSVDGYSETGSAANLTVSESDSDSLRSRLGGEISYAFNQHGVAITPHLDASWQHEFLDQSRGITSQFGFGGGSFAVRTPNPSRDSALVDAGITADLNQTVNIFADYIAQAGQDNYFGQSVQAGVKIGF